MTIQLDSVDLRLLDELQRDADRTNVELARLVDETRDDLDLGSYRHAVRAPLRSATRALAANRTHRACRALSRYIIAVQTSPGPAFTRVEERSLIADAGRIKAVLGC